MPVDREDDPDFIREFRLTERHLPHWQSPGATHFLTFTLMDRYLCDLTDPGLAPIIIDALQHRHEEKYVLHDYTVMPDHVHVLLWPMRTERGYVSMSRITGGLKGWMAHQINQVLGRSGALWQDETFDHVVRHQREFNEIAHYIWMNPVVAGLVAKPAEWPWWGRGHFCRGPLDGNDDGPI